MTTIKVPEKLSDVGSVRLVFSDKKTTDLDVNWLFRPLGAALSEKTPFAEAYGRMVMTEGILANDTDSKTAVLRTVKAECDVIVREKWDESTSGKKTEAGVQAQVETNKVYVAALDALGEAKQSLRFIHELVAQLKVKYDSLFQTK